MNTRNLPRIDYKLYHETGKKVLKSDCESSEMATPEIVQKSKIEESKIRADINHALIIYHLEDLNTEAEIIEGLEKVDDLSQKFRHSHVELKSLCDDYADLYNDYDTISENLIKFIKNAKKKLNMIRQDASALSEKRTIAAKEKAHEQAVQAQDRERLEMCKVEEELLHLKMSQYDDRIDIESCTNICSIEEYVVKMEKFLEEYFSLSRNLKYYLGADYDAHYGPKFQKKTKEMGEEIKMAKILKQKLVDISEQKKVEKSAKTKQISALLGAKNLSSEIELRCEFLSSEFNQNLEIGSKTQNRTFFNI